MIASQQMVGVDGGKNAGKGEEGVREEGHSTPVARLDCIISKLDINR